MYNKSTVPKICIQLAGKKKENKKVATNTKPTTNHASLATQLEIQVEKRTYTYDTDS